MNLKEYWKDFWPMDVVTQIPKETLSTTEKFTLLLLLQYRRLPEVFVSALTIAHKGSMSLSTVERAFRKFAKLQLMTVKKVRHGSSYLYLKSLNRERIESLIPRSRRVRKNDESRASKFSLDLSAIESAAA